jgi:hypothetical protein
LVPGDLVLRDLHQRRDLGLGLGVTGSDVLGDLLDAALGVGNLHGGRPGSGLHLMHKQAHSSSLWATD